MEAFFHPFSSLLFFSFECNSVEDIVLGVGKIETCSKINEKLKSLRAVWIKTRTFKKQAKLTSLI